VVLIACTAWALASLAGRRTVCLRHSE
jgi:hypothetical protein